MPQRKPESYVEEMVKQWADEHNILHWKFTPPGEVGWPDQLFEYGGRVAWIEFKADKDFPTDMQLYRIATLTQRGSHAIWTRTFEGATEFLRWTLLDPERVSGDRAEADAKKRKHGLASEPGDGQNKH